jgi:hypothetical protein
MVMIGVAGQLFNLVLENFLEYAYYEHRAQLKWIRPVHSGQQMPGL